MSIRWTPTLIAAVDGDYDRRNASDGRSRFGAYLRQRAADLRDCDESLDAEEFACVVWKIATAPVMVPGYVRIRPDIRAVTPEWPLDGEGRLAFDVYLALPHAALDLARTAIPVHWRDWQTTSDGDGESAYRRWTEPDDTRPALLTAAVIRLTVDSTWNLPTPGGDLLRDAKASVAAVTNAVNRLAGPMVASLRGEGR